MEVLIPAVKFLLYCVGLYFVTGFVVMAGFVALLFVLGGRR